MRQARFTVSLDKASDVAVSVNYATQDGTAVSPADYTAKNGTLNFPPGVTSRDVLVITRDMEPGSSDKAFSMVLTTPSGGTLGSAASGSVVIPGDPNAMPTPVERFNFLYNALHNNANGYFGPQTGANAFSVPRHTPEIDSRIINEAPDYGGQTVSETASFWVGLEAWKGHVSGDWTGYKNAWSKIEQFYIPSHVNQPIAVYDPASPADYTPEGTQVSDYPRLGQPLGAKGPDPLADELEATYGTKDLYLMHWIIDVEGSYGFRNGDGATKNVFMNTYERGMQESSYETISHPSWNDWANGGSQFGYEPLFTQGTQWYPAAPFLWGKKWSYTNAPDSEARAIQWAFWARKFATEQGKDAQILAETNKARKMGDYLRYNLFDKYFRKIGDNQVGATDEAPYDSCHFLINWYAAWGGDLPATGAEGAWSYRIGCSEAHQGYQGLSTAWALASGGGGMAPITASAGDIWKGSLYRQVEMIRWLQSPEGPIAGGVTNSYYGAYVTPTDGRQNARFYGMDYTYSPVWHDPVSNNWVGFQTWGQGRTADLYLEVSDKATQLAVDVRANIGIILDKLVNWFMQNHTLTTDGSFLLPGTIGWTSTVEVPGQTATAPNLEGVYEFLPSLDWDGTGNYGAFWNASTVPNPNLHCTILESGTDLGVAASLIYLLTTYGKAKKNLGLFNTAIPGGTGHTPADAVDLAKELMDRLWKFWDGKGITVPEARSDYKRLGDPIYVPAIFSGTMPNGDPINQSSTFISIRSFLEDDPMWPSVQAHIANPTTAPAPVFTYHRFWAQAEYAISLAAFTRHFPDLI